jgi:putrescine transport system ATP-binding protein
MRRHAEAAVRREVDRALATVRLAELSSRLPRELSGGQQQRVALARCFVYKPSIILMDEPLGALDKKLREETQFELMDIQVELGITFVIVTHDQEEAMTMSDRIAVMDNGKLVQVGPPAEIYEEPNSRYVADFIGDINVLEGKVSGVTGTSVEVLDAAGNRFLVETPQAVSIGQSVFIAVRPEKMRISLDAMAATEANVLKGEIFDIGYLGDWTNYLVEVDGSKNQLLRVSRANMSRFVDRPISWEDKVEISFAPDAGVLLTK